MSSSDPSSFLSPSHRPRRGALERLYVYWLVSTVLVLLAVIGSAILARGALDRQAISVRELGVRVAKLEDDVQELRALAGRPVEPRSRPPADQDTAQTSPPAVTSTAAPVAAAIAPVELPPATEATIQAQLDAAAQADPATPVDVRDPAAVRALLDNVVRDAGRVHWSGATWSRLAVLARLVDHGGAERVCVALARAAHEPLLAYQAVVVRELLASGRAHEALPFASELMQRSDGAPTARVLLAAASLANDDPGASAELLAEWPAAAVLPVYDRLVLARIWMTLEAWEHLAAALQPVREISPALQPEHSLLVAVSLARGGRTVEALALLDALAAPAESPHGAHVRPAPTPSHYEIEVWRGVTLALARKTDVAREVLRAAAELDPGRPEAQYQLGLLEARAGRPEIATAHLKNAVAAAERFAPAWEAWAALELDGGQITLALEHVGRALTINPRRASAHFLTAIAYAKLSRETQAAEALRAAAHLAPHYLEQAKQTEVLLRLFTPAEMDALVAAGDAGTPPASREPETRP